MQLVAATLLGDDILLRPHAQGLMIIFTDSEVDAADKETINLLRWIRRHLLSIRAFKGFMRKTCTWDHVMAMRKTVTATRPRGGYWRWPPKGVCEHVVWWSCMTSSRPWLLVPMLRTTFGSMREIHIWM